MVSASEIRETLLGVMEEFETKGPGFFQSGSILREVSSRLNMRDIATQQALLTLWGDMFRQGVVAPGYDLSNADLPFCHLTEHGRKTLEHMSRDPANPDGYLAAVRANGTLNPISESYLVEAVSTYNAACYKATAVMVGAASEALMLEVRDAVLARLAFHGRQPDAKLNDWRIKTVLDAVNAELSKHTKVMPAKLRESYGYNWPAFTQQIRATRNDAGHPSSVAPVTPESVHASLLIFPELHALSIELLAWVSAAMP